MEKTNNSNISVHNVNINLQMIMVNIIHKPVTDLNNNLRMKTNISHKSAIDFEYQCHMAEDIYQP
jgi:hypothetical protein